MKQLSKHQLNKMTASEIKEAVPFQLVSDGEVFAVVLAMTEASKIKPPHKIAFLAPEDKMPKLRELPLSKHKQAKGELSQNAFSPR